MVHILENFVTVINNPKHNVKISYLKYDKLVMWGVKLLSTSSYSSEKYKYVIYHWMLGVN